MLESPPRVTFSVALCTHNGERFVAEQLSSILNQSRPPSQIVVSDDASGDDTLAVVREIYDGVAASRPVPDLAVIENAHPLGIVGNFSQAILACRADIVVLSDQDDVWSVDRLERIGERFDREPGLCLLHGDARLVDDEGGPLGETLFQALRVSAWEVDRIRSGRALDVLLRRNVVTGATTAVRNSFAQTALPIPPGWIHDEWLGIMAAVSGTIDLIEDCLVDYRQHDRNVIGAQSLTLRGRLSRLAEPRAARNAHLVQRAESLVERLAERDDSQVFARAVRKLEHDRRRLALPASRLLRVPGVARELAVGGYRCFGLGAQDALRDLVQPAS